MRDYRTNLEAEFKKRLVESEKKFRAEAYKALSEEAKVALHGNDQLQSVLQRQNDSIETVLGRCKQLESNHAKMKSEQDVSNQNLQHHQAETTRLRKQLNDTKAKNAQLEEVLRQRKVERASLELLFIEYESTRKQLARSQEKAKRYAKESERWKARAMQLSYDVSTGEGRVANNDPDGHSPTHERRLSRARAQIKDMDETLEKRQERNTQQHNASHGSSHPRHEDWSDITDGEGADALMGDQEEGGDLQAKASITPMEILAMWNVNFESWHESGGASAAVPMERDEMTEEKIAETGLAELQPCAVVPPQPPITTEHSTVRYLNATQSSHLRHKKHTHRITAEEQRSMAERNLSVLSQRRLMNVPPAMQRMGRKEARPISMSELSIVGNDGHFHKLAVGNVNPANARFIIP